MAADIMIMIIIFDIFLRDSLIGRKRVAIITGRTVRRYAAPGRYVSTYLLMHPPQHSGVL